MAKETFGDRCRVYLALARANQKKLAIEVDYPESVISRLFKDELTDTRDARVKILRIIEWFRDKRVISLEQAQALLGLAGQVELRKDIPKEAAVIARFATVTPHGTEQATRPSPETEDPPISTIIFPTEPFVGRDADVDRAVALLDAARTHDRAGILVFHGMSGIGKSELSRAIAWKMRDRFANNPIFLAMGGNTPRPLNPLEAIKRVIHTLHPRQPLPDERQALVALYANLLARRPQFIIADDAPHAASVEDLIPPPGSILIVSSRHYFTLRGQAPMEVRELTAANAEALLHELGLTRAVAAKLATACSCHPLMLRIHGGTITATRTMDAEEYSNRLLADPRLVITTSAPQDPGISLYSLEWGFTTSYDQLPTSTQQALCHLGVFTDAFDLRAAEAVLIGMNAAAETALLVDRSLLQWYDGVRRYRVHDLVRTFALARLADPDAIWLRYTHHYLDRATQLNETFKQKPTPNADREALEQFDQERTHIDLAGQWVSSTTHHDADPCIIAYAALMEGIGRYRYSAQHERIPILEAGIRAAQRQGDRASEGAFIGTIGYAYADTGQYAVATEYYSNALEIARQTGDRAWEGTLNSRLGTAAYFLGQPDLAQHHHQEHLHIATAMQDINGQGAAHNNVGILALNAGQLDRAYDHFTEAYACNLQSNDIDGQARSLGNLGIIHQDRSDFPQALVYFTQQLTITQTLGDRVSEARTLANMGVGYADQGDHIISGQYYEQALAIAQEIGDQHGEARYLHSLGEHYVALWKQKKTDENAHHLDRAEAVFTAAHALYRTLKHQPGESDGQQGLALVLAQRKQFDEAFARYAEVYVLRQTIKDLFMLGYLCQEIGDAYREYGDNLTAFRFYREALDFYRDQDLGHKVQELQMLLQELGDHPAP